MPLISIKVTTYYYRKHIKLTQPSGLTRKLAPTNKKNFRTVDRTCDGKTTYESQL